MKYLFIYLTVIIFFLSVFFYNANSQEIVLKTNMPYLLTTSPNLGVEMAVSSRLSIELTTGFNPFKFGEYKRIKHWVVWPELRYWTIESFKGHFFGIHGVGGQFNFSGWDLGIDKFQALKNNRYQGSAIGAGLSYGYHWALNNIWALELTAGIGFARFNYETYSLDERETKIGQGKKNYFGPTKGSFSLVYTIK